MRAPSKQRQPSGENRQKCPPPLKWAGGKRWLVSSYAHLLPKKYDRYIEPFAGSAAVFFHLEPQKAVLADLNEELINLYRVIRDAPDRLKRRMSEHQLLHSPSHYYQVRSSKPRSAVGKAARMLYLNRTCWNGLYRVNKDGDFNVPIGTKTNVLLESDDFYSMSGMLKNVELMCADFESVLDQAGPGDFVFLDPPYTVAHNNNGFLKYNEKIFSWDDQVRLANSARTAANRGAKIMVTNANHVSVKELYEGFDTSTVTRHGVISSKAEARGAFEEAVFRCY